jgi:uncharacterized membrane protein HdeD (DUF308 family)
MFDMRLALARNWWSLVLRGIAAILLAIVTLLWPGITLTALIFLFGAYAFVDGVLALVGAVRAAGAKERWGSLLIEGLAGIAAGVITVIWPGITALALVLIIAAWAIVTGIVELVAAVRLRRYVQHEWLLALSGIASLVFGILMIMAPLAGALVIALFVGGYALAFGVILISLGIRMRGLSNTPLAGPSVTAPAH